MTEEANIDSTNDQKEENNELQNETNQEIELENSQKEQGNHNLDQIQETNITDNQFDLNEIKMLNKDLIATETIENQAIKSNLDIKSIKEPVVQYENSSSEDSISIESISSNLEKLSISEKESQDGSDDNSTEGSVYGSDQSFDENHFDNESNISDSNEIESISSKEIIDSVNDPVMDQLFDTFFSTIENIIYILVSLFKK